MLSKKSRKLPENGAVSLGDEHHKQNQRSMRPRVGRNVADVLNMSPSLRMRTETQAVAIQGAEQARGMCAEIAQLKAEINMKDSTIQSKDELLLSKNEDIRQLKLEISHRRKRDLFHAYDKDAAAPVSVSKSISPALFRLFDSFDDDDDDDGVARSLAGSSLMLRVGDMRKVKQFSKLMRTRLAGKHYRLLYTWSQDGRSNGSFHRHCDKQGPTLVIVRSTSGYTFGGYASKSWDSQHAHGPYWRDKQSLCSSGVCHDCRNSFIEAAGSFLFLVENHHGDPPTCFESQDASTAMACSPRAGPCFGMDGIFIHHHDFEYPFEQDLDEDENEDEGMSYSCLPDCYMDTLGRGPDTFTPQNSYSDESDSFAVEDYEVWAVM